MATIYFDMDGTIADFYSVPHWLDYLERMETTPYELAKPMLNFSLFARLLHAVQAKGIRIGIISALSHNGNADFHARICTAKNNWLAQHLPSVNWDEIHFVPYGSNKIEYATDELSMLFDDEFGNRANWIGITHTPDKILEVLRYLAKS